jgi:hypothetical protein
MIDVFANTGVLLKQDLLFWDNPIERLAFIFDTQIGVIERAREVIAIARSACL